MQFYKTSVALRA